jgi:hypothetical protein
MSKKTMVIILIFLFLNENGMSLGRCYYIDPSYQGKSDGRISSPFRTIGDLYTIQLQDGDSILFKGGEKFIGPLVIEQKMNKGLFISSYGQGKAIIDGVDGPGITINRSQYINISNLELLGSGRKSGNTKNGCEVINSKKISLKNINVKGFQKSGIYIYCSEYVNVLYCNISENGMAGIMINGENKKSSRNIRIEHCKAFNNPGDPTNLTNHSGNGILAGNCTKVLIDQCEAYENGWDMPRIGNGPVGIWTYESDSVTIQNSKSHHNKTAKGADDGGGFDLDGGVTNAIIQNCISYENEGAGYGIFQYAGASPWLNNVIRNCTSSNDGKVSRAKAGVFIWNNSEEKNNFSGLLFINNKIENKNGAAIRFLDDSKHTRFKFLNNTFISKEGLKKWDKIDVSDTFKGNIWK